MRINSNRLAIVAAAAFSVCGGQPLAAAEPAAYGAAMPAPPGVWRSATAEEVHGHLSDWLATEPLSISERQRVLQAWDAAFAAATQGTDFLDLFVASVAQVEPPVARLMEVCSSPAARTEPIDPAFLSSYADRLLLHNNLRLYYGRWLVQVGLYDEALAATDGLSPHDVIAPQALLFYRSVAHYYLVQPDESLSLLAQLRQREMELPRRYAELARLMEHELENLTDDSLEHIARRMADIRRRLEKGRSDETVQGIEDGVIASLDKLIEQVEQQLQQQQAASQGQSGGSQPSTPMNESRLAQMNAPGEVQPRDIGNTPNWGNLPPRERDKALQDIGREFPAHYRQVIEQYFRQLADDGSGPTP